LGPRVPFIAAAVIALIGAVVGYRYLAETLPRERRRRFDPARANPLGTLIRMLRYPLVTGFLATILLMQLATQTTPAVWSYYTILKFGWSPATIGLSAAFFGILIAIVQGGLTGPAIARFGEARTGMVALAFAVPAYLVFAFATAGWMMFAGIFIAATANMTFPAMQALMSRAIPEDAQGELQGAVASTISLTSIAGPVLMAGVFARFADAQGLYFPGAAFLLAAVLMACAVVLFALNARRNLARHD
jgi:DHA1 family tetracycline resistance protein-like MFS transporter